MTATIRISEPREMLALIPHQVGFRPVESVVAVSLRPPRGRVGLVVRVDLAALADRAAGPALARAVVGHLDRDGARSAVLVVYTAQDPRGEPDHPAELAVETFRAAASWVADTPAWVVTDEGYLSMDCLDECCPLGGRPLAELEGTQVGARMVLAGSAVADRREDVATITPARAESRRSVARVRARWSARGASAAAQGPVALESWRLGSVAAWREEVVRVAGDPSSERGSATGRLEAGLRDLRVRDALLIALVPGTGTTSEEYVRGPHPGPSANDGLAEALAKVYDPVAGVRPPGEVTDVHVRVLEQVIAHGRAGEQAPALTLLGMLAWWSGAGARAALLIERALRDDRDYRLAARYAQAGAAGLPPGWVRAGR